ncbi:monodechloroaminopyrrolnitrin synthase PrnB family protein [Amycolatopsis suaedae]|uniref:DUF1864 family protein n=1 Tax=Amycolatopsis suaedae TaxID=2510978 RepID=A0A4V2ELC1_9PSEU|nr:monodechloroaminopyrrolnitrin synthase PrnB family protein [Amycolatopsis suaedae]RZQ61045.1 DUF1864 family protein [Amycolatopsis suaedae]
MTGEIGRFDRWLRHEFVDVNTELEEAYFAERSEIIHGVPALESAKGALERDGADHIAAILDNASLPAGDQARYQLLGKIGLYLAACRRHEYLTFTSLPDELLFVVRNGLAVLAYQRAADALRRIPPMGVSSPLATYLLETARAALDDVLEFNRGLAEALDVDRFFLNVRPYFKPYLVGTTEYRGANAGDFAAVNEVDLLLGLCAATDPFYAGVIREKTPFTPPEDQAALRAAVTGDLLLDMFLRETALDPVPPRLRRNTELFLEVCRAHGAAYIFHHHRLVRPFLEAPAKWTPPERLATLTASGPPLDVVIAQLERLSDLQAGRDRPGLSTARASLNCLLERIVPVSLTG